MCMSFTVLYKGINQFSVFQKIKLGIDKTDDHFILVKKGFAGSLFMTLGVVRLQWLSTMTKCYVYSVMNCCFC